MSLDTPYYEWSNLITTTPSGTSPLVIKNVDITATRVEIHLNDVTTISYPGSPEGTVFALLLRINDEPMVNDGSVAYLGITFLRSEYSWADTTQPQNGFSAEFYWTVHRDGYGIVVGQPMGPIAETGYGDPPDPQYIFKGKVILIKRPDNSWIAEVQGITKTTIDDVKVPVTEVVGSGVIWPKGTWNGIINELVITTDEGPVTGAGGTGGGNNHPSSGTISVRQYAKTGIISIPDEYLPQPDVPW